MVGRFPNLLIIGAMKSGTTSLHDYLDKHPDIFMSNPKELHYYADANYGIDTKEQYQNLFITDKKIAGTTPQSYTKAHHADYKNIPERIYKDTPNVKLIYIVRDPVKRYESHILESFHCDSQEDIKYSKESGNYWKTSLYGFQLSHYLEYFNKDQILIVDLDDLKSSRLGQMNRIFDFLSVPRLMDNELFNYTSNSAESKGIPRKVKDSLYYRLLNKISPKLAVSVGNKLAAQFYSKLMQKPLLSEAELEDIKSKLGKDVAEFRKMTGMEFKKWSI